LNSLTREELSEMSAEERKLHFENERKNVFGHDYKTDRHGRPIEQGIGSASQPSLNHFQALAAAEGQEVADAEMAKAVKAGTWPPKPRSEAF
jgi:hypothetical protein